MISHLTAGRSQIGTSLGFHLFFAVLGVGLPLMMLVAEGMYLHTGDRVWRALARRWSKVFAVLPLVLIGLAAATLSLLALRRGRYLVARGACVLTGVSLLWGWFVIQAPRLIGPRLTIHSAAATPAALDAIAISAGVVLLLVLPAMYLLFVVFARPELEVPE